MSKKVSVAIDPEALKNMVVESALFWAGQLHEEHYKNGEEAIAKFRRIGYVIVHADKFDGDHHYGPTMTFDGARGPLELTIPWRYILSFVSGKSGKMKIGFDDGQDSRTPKPKRKRISA